MLEREPKLGSAKHSPIKSQGFNYFVTIQPNTSDRCDVIYSRVDKGFFIMTPIDMQGNRLSGNVPTTKGMPCHFDPLLGTLSFPGCRWAPSGIHIP